MIDCELAQFDRLERKVWKLIFQALLSELISSLQLSGWIEKDQRTDINQNEKRNL